MAQKFKPTTPLKTSAAASAPKATKTLSNEPVEFIFDKSNYKFLIISVLIVAFGFVLMSGTTDIYSNTKTYQYQKKPGCSCRQKKPHMDRAA